MSQYRYPGTQPFSTGQQHLFFGREEDIARLYRLVKTQPLTVLYGKSGLGKSSLLNAGLIPEVVAEGMYTPLNIRFNAWTEGKEEHPVDITLQTLSPTGSRTTFLDSLIKNERSLWHELKEAQIATANSLQYLLVFDQFEELFTYPADAIAAFKEQLAEAIYTKIPQRYREVLEKQVEQGTCVLTDTEFDQLQAQPNVRILLSIRADRMHLMERLSDALPDILSHCYELMALSPQGAEAAITAPAALQGDFQTPAYAYTPAALSEIIAFLDDADGRIETVQLQILCRNFEERAKAEEIRLFDKQNLGNLGDIIAHFYHRQLAALGDEAAQQPARRLIEDGLIMPEDKQRLTLHEAQIAALFKVPRAHLNKLVDSGLLRAEPALRGGYAYELSHDTLVAPALIARQARKLAEENAALAEERRKRQRARNLALTFALLSLLSLAAAAYAFGQTLKARKAEAEALRQKQEVELQRAEAIAQKSRADESQRLAELSAKEALTEKERAEFQTLLAKKAEQAAQALAAKGNQLENTINATDTYGFLIKKGQDYLLDGDYRNALTYFATARFTNDAPEAARFIALAQKGLQAEKAFGEGQFVVAKQLYAPILAFSPQAKAAERLLQMDEADKAHEELASDALTSVSFAGKGLYALPAGFGERKTVEALDLTGNFFPAIPPMVFQLSQLRELVCADGMLEQIPQDIARLSKLRLLNLQNNRSLAFLSPAIGQLANLESLQLDQCIGLRQIPPQIGLLTQLKTLEMGSSALESLPPALAQLKQLQTLDLSTMEKLRWTEAFPLLYQLRSLQKLNISGNNFDQLPKGLANLERLSDLDLSYNNLKSLPPEIANLKSLKYLSLKDNPLAESEKAKIKEWLPNCILEF